MAVVPAPTGFSVAPAGALNVRVPDAPVANTAGQQMAALGGAVSNLGSNLSAIALDAQQQANQVRVNNALNAIKERSLALSYDPQEGFTNLKGEAVMTRPDGKSIFQEYDEKLTSAISAVSENLSNDAQRRAFAQGAAQIQTTYNGALLQHYNQEARNFALSTNSSMATTASNEIVLSDDPNVKAAAAERIRMATAASFKLIGKSEAEANDTANKIISGAHAMAIADLLDKNDTASAQQYFNEYHDSITDPDDLLRTEAKLRDATDVADVTATVSAMVAPGGAAAPTTDFDALLQGVKSVEGGGTLDKPNTSPKGAQGPMQVMAMTGLNPGYGVRPADKDILAQGGAAAEAERVRLGVDYLKAMLTRYGTRMGLAAYNGGPGRADAAIAKAKKQGGDPLSYMPAETQKYVPNVLAAAGAGDSIGNPSISLADGLALIRQKYANNPKALAMATQQFSSAYSAMLSDKQRTEQDQVGNAMRQIYNNGGSLTPAIAASVPAKYLDSLQSFAHQTADAISNPPSTEKSTQTWALAKERIANHDMTMQQLFDMGPQLSKSQFADLAGDIAAISSGDQKKVDSYNTLKQTLDVVKGDMAAAGIDFTPNANDPAAAKKYSDYTAALMQQFSAIENITGKPLKPDEAVDIARKLLATVPHTGGWFTDDRRFELANPQLIIPTSLRVQVENQLRLIHKPITPDNIRDALRVIYAHNHRSTP